MSRIQARVPEAVKAQIGQAAAICGQNEQEFVVSESVKAAHATIMRFGEMAQRQGLTSPDWLDKGASAATALDNILADARRVGASDVHILPNGEVVLLIAGMSRDAKALRLGDEDGAWMLPVLTARSQRPSNYDAGMVQGFVRDEDGVGYRWAAFTTGSGVRTALRLYPAPAYAAWIDEASRRAAQEARVVIVTALAGNGKSRFLPVLASQCWPDDRIFLVSDLYGEAIELRDSGTSTIIAVPTVDDVRKTLTDELRSTKLRPLSTLIVDGVNSFETFHSVMSLVEIGLVHRVVFTLLISAANKVQKRLLDSAPPEARDEVGRFLLNALIFSLSLEAMICPTCSTLAEESKRSLGPGCELCSEGYSARRLFFSAATIDDDGVPNVVGQSLHDQITEAVETGRLESQRLLGREDGELASANA